MLNKFLVRFYPLCIAAFGVMVAFEALMKHVQSRDIIFFAITFLIFLPTYAYPRWKKRQLAPPAVQSAPTSRLKDILFSLGVWSLFIIPAVLAIYAFPANGLVRKLALLAVGMLAPLVFLFFRFKLWRRG